MKKLMQKLEDLMEIGGTKKDIAFLVIGGVAVICSLLNIQPFRLISPGLRLSCAAFRLFWKPSLDWSQLCFL